MSFITFIYKVGNNPKTYYGAKELIITSGNKKY